MTLGSAGRTAAILRPGDDDSVIDADPTPLPPERPSAPRLPPDPAAYDTERNAAARRRGLQTPYIPGGTDPDEARTAASERRLTRILLAMVITIVLSGFVLGILALLLGFDALAGRPG